MVKNGNDRHGSKVPFPVHRFALIMVFIFAGMTSALGQAPCKVFIADELRTPQIIDLLERTSGILDLLASRRELFLSTGNMLEIFPASYYHTTRALLEEISRVDKESAVELFGLVVDFYAAYEDNRQRFDRGGPKAVEPHWKAYYESAVKRNRAKSTSGIEVFAVLLYGVDAHLTDLSRSLRRSFIGKAAVRKDLEVAYRNLDRSNYRAAAATNNDIAVGRKITGRLLEFEKQFDLGARYVIQLREKAWIEAVSGGTLRASEPHPKIESPAPSANHFTFDRDAACPPSK